MSCAQCEALIRDLRAAREELAEWERVGMRRDNGDTQTQRIEAVRRLVGMSFGVGRMMLALLDAAPSVVKHEALFDALDHRDSFADQKIVAVQMSRCRVVLGRQGFDRSVIKTSWGVGYYIDAVDAGAILAAAGLEEPGEAAA